MKKSVLVAVVLLSLTSAACEEGDGGLNTATQCQSGESWEGIGESPLMTPGQACNECHRSSGEGPIYKFSGTVYDLLDDPDNCTGIEGATVQLVGADGKRVSMTSNATGNFFTRTGLKDPVTASVTVNGNTVAMVTPVTSADCNSCHTPKGANGAAGRIIIPTAVQ